MNTRTNALLAGICLAFSTTAFAAPPKLDEGTFLGAWEGEMVATIADQATREDLKMDFKAGGTVAITSGKPQRTETSGWRYDAQTRRLVFEKLEAGGTRTPEAYLTDIRLSDAGFSADMVPAGAEGLPKGASLRLELRRAKGGAAPVTEPERSVPPGLPKPGGDLTKKAIEGKWTGTMVLTHGTDVQREKIAMDFQAGGMVVITTLRGEREKQETVPYEVDATLRRVLFRDGKTGEPDAYLESMAIDAKSIRGQMVPAQKQSLPEGTLVVLELTR